MTSAKLSGGVGLGIEGIHVENDLNREWKLPWGYYGSLILSREILVRNSIMMKRRTEIAREDESPRGERTMMSKRVELQRESRG